MYRPLLLATLLCLCPGLAAAADQRLVLQHQGMQRSIQLALPDGSARPSPLVIALHGAGDDAAGFRRTLDLDAPAAAAGIVVAWPDGYNSRWQYSTPLLRGPAVPPTMPDGAPLDDRAFLEALIARLVADGIADPARIYLTGFSVGGLMTFTAGCANPRRFAAIAPLAAGIADYQAAACAATPPLPMLLVAGDADRVFPWAGFTNARGRMLSQPETLAFFAGRNRCAATGNEAPLAGGPLLLRQATGCEAQAAVALLRAPGGEHVPPPGTGAALVAFFAQHARQVGE